MQEQGIIVSAEFSQWGTPLVCVAKTYGTVRLCGDYKCTVNMEIKTESYAIPTTDEVGTLQLAGGTKFSKIDLKCAYP